MRIAKYVDGWVDKKTGIPYVRFRRGKNRIMARGLQIGTPEFWTAYHAWLRGEQIEQAVAAVTARTGAGTINNAVGLYLGSTAFAQRVPSEATRQRQTSTLKKFCTLVGDKPLALLDRKYIDKLLQDMPTVGVARTLLITLRPFLEWAVTEQMIEADPTAGIKIKLPKSDGHDTWTDEQIAQFGARWPIGTKERLALVLLVHTGQRRSDIIRMGRKHASNGVLAIKQSKRTRAGQMTVEIPMHPELVAAIDACPTPQVVSMHGGDAYLLTATGRPFKERAFNDWFREACNAAGLPESCVPHGLRKACCRRLADLGLSPQRIGAISGHLTLKEIERYTKAYDRRQAAKEAMAALVASHQRKAPVAA
jgi:integrase